LKAEAIGYPGWVQISEDGDKYVQIFQESVGIKLAKANIQTNAAKKGLV